MFKTVVFALAIATAWPLYASEPFVIFEGEGSDIPKQPQAFVATDDVAHLVFGVRDQVFYCNLESELCSIPNVAFRIPNLSLGMRRGPRIAVSGETIVVASIGGTQGKGQDGDVLTYRSEDKGKSWVGPVRVNDVESSAREGLHAMMVTDSGTLWCVWLDLRSKKTELYASKSDDHGKSWTKNVIVYRSPEGSICECCHPSIATDGNSIHILFRNSLAGNRDMYLVSSRDQGDSFGEAIQVGSQHWKLNACPMDGGMLAVQPGGEVISAWRNGRAVYTSRSKSSMETLLGQGEQAWTSANSLGAFVVWTTAREGNLFFSKLGSVASKKLAEKARDPVIVSSKGDNPFEFVFWEQRTENQTFIMGQRMP